jgi:hypothetical protein
MKDNSWNIWNRNLKVSEPACLQKWEWSTIYLEHQNSSSCHRVKKEPFDIETFNFHNTPGVLEARTKMLNGIWPGKGCEYCKDLEDAGGLSDRQHVNNNNKLTYLTPKELEQDNTSVNVTPSTLEVYFSNLCNQACLYCFAKHSSKIESEYRRIDPENGELKFINEKRKNYKQAKNNFWLWMKDNCINLKRYRILGGEPFIQSDLTRLIDHIDKVPHPKLEFNVVTNLNLPYKTIHPHLFRLSNSIGLIDMGYRGTLKAKVDVIEPSDHIFIGDGTRYFQLCRQSWMPWESVKLVDELPPAPDSRGSGGFGSTGH